MRAFQADGIVLAKAWRWEARHGRGNVFAVEWFLQGHSRHRAGWHKTEEDLECPAEECLATVNGSSQR